jgi:hypothetical protein
VAIPVTVTHILQAFDTFLNIVPILILKWLRSEKKYLRRKLSTATQKKKITAQQKKSAAQSFLHACTEVKNARLCFKFHAFQFPEYPFKYVCRGYLIR